MEYMPDVEVEINDIDIHQPEYISSVLIKTQLGILRNFANLLKCEFNELVDKYMIQTNSVDRDKNRDILLEFGYVFEVNKPQEVVVESVIEQTQVEPPKTVEPTTATKPSKKKLTLKTAKTNPK